jgi:hypothetical protein
VGWTQRRPIEDIGSQGTPGAASESLSTDQARRLEHLDGADLEVCERDEAGRPRRFALQDSAGDSHW